MIKILDLGMHPYADTFISPAQLGLTEPILPLECYLCPESGQVQLGYVSRDTERYNLYAYSYTSANSKTSRAHWDDYYQTMVKRFNPTDQMVVEIGSNDGYLIRQFQADNRIVGVDPSIAMAKIAKEQSGVTTITELFSLATAQRIRSDLGAAHLMIANNVFNHSNNPLDFARGVATLLQEDGVFVFESPYWLDTIQSQRFDQIYHEHVSYFTVKSAFHLLAQAGLEIFDVERVDYHGGSLRVYAKKLPPDTRPQAVSLVSEMIEAETQLGLFEVATYRQFQKDITTTRDKFLAQLYAIHAQGHPIVAVGAAAKGNTFLNFYGLDHTVIDYVTDSSEHKQGKLTPLTRIPIVGDEIFQQYPDEVYAVILSWNISDAIKNNLRKINSKIQFL